MKRKPNGYGTIKRMGGNRECPFAALTPFKYVNGKKMREPIGYFPTYEEADQALATWNRGRGTKTNYTLKQLYDEWEEKAYKKISKSTASCYRAAWKQMAPLYKMKVRVLRTGHFQDIVDRLTDEGKSFSAIRDIKLLSGQLEKYAMQYDIIEKNYAEFIELPAKEEKEREIFTAEQIEILEKAAEADFMYARLIVILNYTGWRISEFLALTVQDYNPENNTFTGGMKTDYGKNRIVPVHPHIQGYVDELLRKNGPRLVCREETKGKGAKAHTVLVPVTSAYFRERWFKPTLDKLGVKQKDGSDFTPHVTRHTFATNCWSSGVDPLVTKKILGHSPAADVTEKTYIHVDVNALNEGISQIKAAKK